MKLFTQVLATLVLICALNLSAPGGEISCGIDGKAPCVQQNAPILEEIPEETDETPGATDGATWEIALTLLQGIISVF